MTKLGLLLLGTLVGCLGCSGEEAVEACDPLQTETQAIDLGNVQGAGQDEDGIIYVLSTTDDGQELAFVSEAGELYRQRVVGSAQETRPDGTSINQVSLELDPQLRIQVEEGPDAKRMGVLRGELTSTKTFSIGEQGIELEMIEPSTLAEVPRHNYPAEILVEYSAVLEDGRLLLVLRPRDFTEYNEFRVFFGAPGRLEERELTSIGRARDGGSTTIEFDVSGEKAHAEFPVEFVDEQFVPGEPSLTVAGEALALSLQARAASPDGAQYYCRD